MAQETPQRPERFYYKPALGFNIPLTGFFDGRITDNLIKYNEPSWYWQLISGTLFFYKNWGFEFSIQAGNSSAISKKKGRFDSEISSIYASKYYILPGLTLKEDNSVFIIGDISRWYLGIVYRIEKNKLLLMPKLSAGMINFFVESTTLYLKEKNTNNLFEVSFESNKGIGRSTYATINPGLTLGWHLTSHLIVNLDLLYSFYEANFEYTKTIKNLGTDVVIEEQKFKYKKPMSTITIGAGLILVIKGKIPKIKKNE